jgi:hypothetical protein
MRKRTNQLVSLAVSIALTATLGAAYAASSSPPPGTAPVTSGPVHLVSQAQFDQLAKERGALVLGSSTVSEEETLAREEETANLNLIRDYLDAHPTLDAFGDLLTDAPNPNDPADGDNYQIEVTSADGSMFPQWTMGLNATAEAMANAITQSTDPATQLALYTAMYDRYAPYIAQTPGAANRPQVIEPAQLQGAGLQAIHNALDTLGSYASTIIVNLPPGVQIPLEECQSEQGADDMLAGSSYGDQTGNSLGRKPDPDGIFAKYHFQGKGQLTCIRSQGARDICHSFANTAAMEYLVARETGLHVNLSEQDLFEHDHFIWSQALTIETGSAWREMSHAIESGYMFAYEKQWDYNPSLSRTHPHKDFGGMCTNYPAGEPGCSDTAPQPPEFCVLDIGFGSAGCLYLPAILPGAPSPYSPVLAMDLMQPHSMQTTLAFTQLWAASGMPVVISVKVTDAFGGSSKTGIIAYDSSNPGANNGQHAILVVGSIDNATLAKEVPGTPAGSGGGYLIIKNSWGTNAGDAGYYYMPYAYFMDKTVDAFVLVATTI